MPTKPTSAFSLLEVVIAVAVFSVLMASLLESMTSAKRYETASIVADDLQADCDAAARTITSDLAASGWYFYSLNDSNGDGVIQANESVDGSTTVKTVDFASATVASDRRMRYYPYIRGETASTRDSAFPTRVDIDPGSLANNELARLSPWTTRLYPTWTMSGVSSLVNNLLASARQRGVVLPNDPVATAAYTSDANVANAAHQLRKYQVVDLATEMVQPSNEIIFLRGATGPWNADPAASDRFVPPDLQTFFPIYYKDATGALVKPDGATATSWRTAGNQVSTANPHGLPVLFPSGYTDDGSGGYVHRNSLLPSTDPQYGKPYGVTLWGAFLDDGSSGLSIRMQWETLSANRMDKDPNPGVDDYPLPDDLREFTYAVIPSPIGFGRLVRAHTVLASMVGPGTLGVEVGNWITDPSAARGYAIDKILSDNVVRMVWMTRRHDQSLGVNQVRARFTFARASRATDGAKRMITFRQMDQVFTMRANNDYDDQKAAAAVIDVPTAPASNPPTSYGNLAFTF